MSVTTDRPRVAPVTAGVTTKVPYLPGLDGLRAFAVLAVVLYHADVSWMGGGFLGVEVFFVISGYLITLLLIGEHERTGLIDLRAFWMRRARRLLPALYTLLAVVSVVMVLFMRDQMAKLRGDIVAAFFYVTNWYLIVNKVSYFDQLGRPSPLMHLWSLAVEEQFYLVWPLLVLALLTLFRRDLRRMALAFVAIIIASTAMMAYYYDAADPSRAYYGTDTRAASLVTGALLALFWRPAALSRGKAREHGHVVDLFGVFALLGLLALNMRATEKGAFLYRGGFLVASIVTCVVIAAVTHPRSYLSRRWALGNPVLTYIGTRSYGLYLWHWPIFCFTRPGIDLHWAPNSILGMRLGLTFLVTELSYRFIEQPIRGGALKRWWAAYRASSGAARRVRNRRILVGAGAGLAAVALVGGSLASAQPRKSDIALSLEAGQQALGAGGNATPATTAKLTATGSTTPGSPPTTATSASATTAAPPATAAAGQPPPTTAAQPVPATTPPPSGAYPIVFIGDSVMLGAAPALRATFGNDVYIDAVVGRSFLLAPSILQALRDQGRIGNEVVIHLGNNGGASGKVIDQIMQVLQNVPKVVFVNVKVPRKWEGPTNDTLAQGVPKYPNAKILDWHDLGGAHPEFFYDDGIHLKPPGARFYAQQVQAALS